MNKYLVFACSFLIISCVSGVVLCQNDNESGKKMEDILEKEDQKFKLDHYFIEGEKYFILEDYAKAYEFFLKALALDPENAAINFKLAEVLSLNGDSQKAEAYASEAKQLQPENKYYYLLLAQIHTANSNFEAAAETYEALIQKIPSAKEYLFELAAIYMYMDKNKKALETYNRAEEYFGVNEDIISQKQKIYLKENDLDLALAEGWKLINSYPAKQEYVIALAEMMIINDLYEEAKQLLKALITEHNDPSAKVLLSEVYRKQNNYKKAIPLLNDAFSDREYNLSAKIQMLSGYMSQLPNPELDSFTIVLSKKLTDAHPGSFEAHAMSGDMYFTLGNKKAASDSYLKALELDKSNYSIWRNIINLEFEREKYDLAANHFETALEYFPNQVELYYLGGASYYSLKKYKKAIRSLEQGKNLVVNNPKLKSSFLGMLGDAYNGIEDHKYSDEAYEKALKENPDNDHVLNNYSYFLSLRGEKLEFALEMSSKLVENFPDNYTYLDTHGWVLYMLEEYKKAKSYLEKAIEIGPEDGTILEHYGDVLYQLGNIDEAIEIWKKASEHQDSSDLILKKIADKKLYE